MGVIRSILLLAGVVCSVGFAYFVGNGLSSGHGKPFALGAILLGIGLVLLTIVHKTGSGDENAGSHH